MPRALRVTHPSWQPSCHQNLGGGMDLPVPACRLRGIGYSAPRAREPRATHGNPHQIARRVLGYERQCSGGSHSSCLLDPQTLKFPTPNLNGSLKLTVPHQVLMNNIMIRCKVGLPTQSSTAEHAHPIPIDRPFECVADRRQCSHAQ
jgi:hypothetical protein